MIGAIGNKSEEQKTAYIQGPTEVAEKNDAIVALNAYNKIFSDARKTGKPFNKEIFSYLETQFKALGFDMPEPPPEVLCAITNEIFNIPIKVTTVFPKTDKTSTHYFDYSTLSQHHKANLAKFKQQGIFCTHPINRLPIKSYHIQPAPEVLRQVHEYIEAVKLNLKEIQASPELSGTLQQLKKYAAEQDDEQKSSSSSNSSKDATRSYKKK